MPITCNLNDRVKVRITKSGETVWLNYWQQLESDRPIERDLSGFTELQLWEVMSIFGPHLYNGCTPPIETFFQLL